MGPMPRQRFPYFMESLWGSHWHVADPVKHRWAQAKLYGGITVLSLLVTEWITRNFLYTFDEFPTEEVRRSYEFPEPLRNKYRQIFGEMDHDGKYVDPSEFHKEGNLLRDFPDEHGHGHH